MFAGPLALQLETLARSAARFSLNQPDRIYGDQRATRVFSGITIHASGERGFVGANAWLGSPDVRTHLQHIASADPAYALHVRGKEVELITAAVQLDLLAPALVALATSLEATAEPEAQAEGRLPTSLAPLMRFREFAIADDLDRSELFETRAWDVRRVARELEPFVTEIDEYLGTPDLVWTKDVHALSDLLELVLEARLSDPAQE